jgi:hypothetical protein
VKKIEGFDAALMNLLHQARAKFDTKRATATNPYLKERYELARNLTVLAASKIEDLPDLLEAYLAKGEQQKLADDAEASTKALVKQAGELIDRLKKEKDPEARRLLDMEQKALSYQLQCKKAWVGALISNEEFNSLPQAIQSLAAPLRLAVKPDRAQLKKEAAASAFEVGVGSIPVLGAVLAAAMALERLTDLEEKQGKTVDDHLNYVDAYIVALTSWCKAADEVIERLRR